MILKAMMLLTLIVASYYDFYLWSIHLITLIIIAIITFLNLIFGTGSLLCSYIPILLTIIVFSIQKLMKYDEYLITPADLVVLNLLTTWFIESWYVLCFITTLGFAGIIICIITDREQLPFIPAMSIGWIFALAIQDYLI